MTIHYRQFTKDDYPILMELIQNLYIEDPGPNPIYPEMINRTLNTLSLHPDIGTIFIIEQKEQIAGYAILINFWSNENGGNIVDIDELYIKKEFRSRGIATNFINYLIDTKFNNSVALQLEVTPKNHSARKLYKKLGFIRHKNQFFMLQLKNI